MRGERARQSRDPARPSAPGRQPRKVLADPGFFRAAVAPLPATNATLFLPATQPDLGGCHANRPASTHHTAATGIASPLCRAPGLQLGREVLLSEARLLRPKPLLLSAPPPGRHGHCHQQQPQAILEAVGFLEYP